MEASEDKPVVIRVGGDWSIDRCSSFWDQKEELGFQYVVEEKVVRFGCERRRSCHQKVKLLLICFSSGAGATNDSVFCPVLVLVMAVKLAALLSSFSSLCLHSKVCGLLPLPIMG